MKWTKKQEEAINEKGDILVAAAAGSGKTAVLVERNIRKIIDDKIDINRILAITFTNAAASEMKERILKSLYNELEKNENDDIKRQIRLLPKANISTIHSFCFNIIKENFFNLNLSSDVIIGQVEELEILKQQALDEVLEEEYITKEDVFIDLLNIYSEYRDDEGLRNEILRIYKFLDSVPFNEDWINVALNDISVNVDDYSKTKYGSILIKETKEIIKSSIIILENQIKELSKDFELEKFKDIVYEDISILEKILKINKWDELYNYLSEISFLKWPTDKKVTNEAKNIARDKRGIIRENIKIIRTNYIREETDSIMKDNLEMVPIIKKLFDLTIKLEIKYNELKQNKNILDFADLEKLALKLLVIDKDGEYTRTDIAKQISNKYIEIQVDEYQDINLMQELIIWSISKENVFRVGDLKQSIYKFRNANPDIFLEKYNKYIDKDSKNNKDNNTNINVGTKILLYQNFRSRENIIDFCNDLFSAIMSKELGEIDYTKKEYLNYSADYDDTFITTDIDIISKEKINRDQNIEEFEDTNVDDAEDDEILEDIENLEIESYYIADKIKELIDSKFQITDKTLGKRDIEYRDIVILLRSSKNKSDIIEKQLYEKGIPVYADSSSDFFESIEISLVVSLINIIDNPASDIDFVAVLRSFFGGFSLNEITKIRNINKRTSMYNALLEYNKKYKDEKTTRFVLFLEDLKNTEKYLGITEMLNKILIDSGYMNYISLENNGELKKANLKLFLRRAEEYESLGNLGLYRFIQYLKKLKVNNTDIASANIIGEKENVVRIMTIHSSKGLEFPIVFLSNANKKINTQDLNENILLNLNNGVGIDYIDSKKRIKYNTLIKEAIKIKTKEEIIAEEMRVLYVALTRAREKLIITGTINDADKYVKDIKDLAEMYTIRSEDEIRYMISPHILKKNISFLDWIMFAESIGLRSSNLKLTSIYDFELSKEDISREILKININEFNKELISKVDKILTDLDFVYPNQYLLQTKVAASRIDMNVEKDIQEDIRKVNMSKPKFMKSKEFTRADIGTLNHYFLEKLPFTKNYTLEELKLELDNLVKNEIIQTEEAEHIDLNNILQFINTDEYLIIKDSKMEKEKQFISKFTIQELYNILEKQNKNLLENKLENLEESILVQGMIDLYYITADNKIRILDYKTDYVDENTGEEELRKRYTVQMQVYKVALEKAMKKEVEKILIYSTTLNKYIEI